MRTTRATTDVRVSSAASSAGIFVSFADAGHKHPAEVVGEGPDVLTLQESWVEPVAAGTHLEHGLEHSARRCAQMTALMNHLADTLGDETQRRDALPALLAGDLNCTPESDEYRCATGLSAGAVPNFTLVDAWTAAGNTDPGHTWSARNPLVPRHAIHPHRRLDYVMVSTPRRPGAGHVRRCSLAGTSAVDNVWASDHFAVVAEVRM